MTICGLDFGTSNSTVGVVKQNLPTMVPLEQDPNGEWQTTLPSALFFSFEDDDVSFGRSAIDRYTLGEPGRLLRSMKSLLGGAFMGDKTQVKNRLYSFDEIIGFFIGSLKTQSEVFAGPNSPPLQSVVMGRPVYFNDTDPRLDQAAQDHLAEIARLAGFKEVSFQYEPIAAAMDYEQQVTKEELALIIDIGGGTSDFTLIRLSPDRHGQADRQQDFLANHGVHLGGTDFDARLSVNSIMPEFGMGMPMTDKPGLDMPGSYYFDLATWHKIHLLYDRRVLMELKNIRPVVSDKKRLDRLTELLIQRKGHQLASLVEKAKIELSSTTDATIDLESLFVDSPDTTITNCILTQSQLQEALTGDIENIFKTLQETLTQAGLTHQNIDTVFTTGGSTALPMVQACINSAFPNARLISGDLYNSVGNGLLMEAQLRYQ
ncbi:MAG: Hsp70 family protein [Granulosicoccaceae bacterium]